MSLDNLLKIDELQIYRGLDFEIAPGITIHQPTLGEICDYGEKEYFGMIYELTSVGADLKWQLWDMGIDYTEIGDFELFYKILFRGFTKDKTQIIFNDLDPESFGCYDRQLAEGSEPCLYNKKDEIIITEYIYTMIVNILRKMHGLTRNNENPGNLFTKMALIEEARDECLANKNKEYHSCLKNLISTMVNSPGFKHSHADVWNMKINAFMDSVRRIQKIKNADLLLQSGYSGFGVKLKEINKKELDWIGEL